MAASSDILAAGERQPGDPAWTHCRYRAALPGWTKIDGLAPDSALPDL